MRTPVVLTVFVACTHAALAQQPVPSHKTATPPPRPDAVVARVNNAPITSASLEAALRDLLPMESFHRNVSAQKVEELRKTALNNLVDEELRYQEGVRLGVVATEADIDAGLARAVAGYKNRAAFEAARRQAGASITDIRREIRRALTIKNAYGAAVASRCEVRTDEAARYFADNPDRFVLPEQLHVYAITIGVDPGSPARQWTDAKTRAEDVLRQIKAGASFEEMARKHSTDKSREQGGDMGLVHRGSLTDELEHALRDLKPGQISPVVQTLYGYHIVRVASIRPPEKKSFSEVAKGIQNDLTRKRCTEMTTAWTARLRAAATIVLTDTSNGSRSRAIGVPGISQ